MGRRRAGGPASGSNRSIRGGNFNNDPRNVRSSNRNRNAPGNRNNDIGFRLCSSADSNQSASPVIITVVTAAPRSGPMPRASLPNGRRTLQSCRSPEPGGSADSSVGRSSTGCVEELVHPPTCLSAHIELTPRFHQCSPGPWSSMPSVVRWAGALPGRLMQQRVAPPTDTSAVGPCAATRRLWGIGCAMRQSGCLCWRTGRWLARAAGSGFWFLNPRSAKMYPTPRSVNRMTDAIRRQRPKSASKAAWASVYRTWTSSLLGSRRAAGAIVRTASA